jgi:hypothetical protein
MNRRLLVFGGDGFADALGLKTVAPGATRRGSVT